MLVYLVAHHGDSMGFPESGNASVGTRSGRVTSIKLPRCQVLDVQIWRGLWFYPLLKPIPVKYPQEYDSNFPNGTCQKAQRAIDLGKLK